jgi:hypothetical protein
MSHYEKKKRHIYVLCHLNSRFFYVVIILLYMECSTWSILLYLVVLNDANNNCVLPK